jgi:hypothetical protein
MIAYKDFLPSLGDLKKLRESQGLSVALIDVEDLYDEFNFGAKSCQAIKDFLNLAESKWSRPPRFVLLVGGASADRRDYLKQGQVDLVPTQLVDTAIFVTASDDWFVDFNGDGLPEIVMGRLPVRTVPEAQIVVSKIVGYDQSGSTNEVLLVADQNDDSFDFESASGAVETLLLKAGLSVQDIFVGQLGPDAARTELLVSLNAGQKLVNYIGHGSYDLWTGDGLLTSDDAKGLTNGSHLPFIISMTCLNGGFHDPLNYADTLAETLIKAEKGGAVAVWASSGLTEPGGQAVMNQELIRLLFNGQGLTLGEATVKAKAATTDLDVRRTWILFGDPTTKLK